MNTKQKVAKGGLWLTLGEVFGLAARFIRNIIIARMVTKADMGIGTTFAMVVTFLEMFSNLGFESILIQAKEGDNPVFQRMCHLLISIRGFVIGLLIMIAAPFITAFWEIPHATWAFYWLGIIPMIRGFLHMDFYRQQRNYNFTGFAILRSVPFIIVTLIAFPITYWRGDYSALLILAICDVTLEVILSHVVAKRRYGYAWDRQLLNKFLAFGLPMLGSAGLLWLMFYGEQFAIGKWFGMPALGVYGIAFQLCMQPAQLLLQIHDKIALSTLSAAQDNRHQFLRRYHMSGQFTAVVAGGLGIGFIVAGGWIIPLIYSEKYSMAATFIGWLGAMQAMRIFRDSATKASIAMGDTINTIIGNGTRATMIIVAILLAMFHEELNLDLAQGMAAVAMTGFGGELLAYLAMTIRIKHKFDIPIFFNVVPLIVLCCCLIVAALSTLTGIFQIHFMMPLLMMFALWIIYIGITYAMFSDFREICQALVRKIRHRIDQPTQATPPKPEP